MKACRNEQSRRPGAEPGPPGRRTQKRSAVGRGGDSPHCAGEVSGGNTGRHPQPPWGQSGAQRLRHTALCLRGRGPPARRPRFASARVATPSPTRPGQGQAPTPGGVTRAPGQAPTRPGVGVGATQRPGEVFSVAGRGRRGAGRAPQGPEPGAQGLFVSFPATCRVHVGAVGTKSSA